MNDLLVTIQLRQSELADFRAWVNEHRERFERLLEKVDSAEAGKTRVSPSRNAGESDVDDVDDSSERGTAAKVRSILLANGGWMVSGQIIAELKRKYDIVLKRPSLRYHLNHGLEKRIYENRGRGGASKWKAIVTK